MKQRLLLIGWSGADWRLAHPLLDRGELPHLQKLVESGCSGRLGTLPQVAPALLWTSLATGKTADQHGILDAVETDPILGGIRPASSTSRQVKALWNILNQSGRHTNLVNWPATHPAELLKGVCVSPAFCRAVSVTEAGAVHPANLEFELNPLRILPADLRGEDLAMFVPRLAEIDQNQDRRLVPLALALSETITAHAAATWILEHQPWEFLAVHYETIGRALHAFAGAGELYADVVANAYRFHDVLLGRLLQLAGEETSVMLVSDYGMLPEEVLDSRLPEPVRSRSFPGIFCVAGAGVRRDELLYGAGILDVLPTALALCGLASAADLPGRALTEIFEEPVDLPPLIPSWEAAPGESGMHEPYTPEEDAIDLAAAFEELASLGYRDSKAAEMERVQELAAIRSGVQLGRAHQRKGRWTEAIRSYDQARARLARLLPDVPALAEWSLSLDAVLAHACDGAGDKERARQLSDALIASAPHSPALQYLRAQVCLGDGKAEEALAHLRAAEAAAQPTVRSLWLAGHAYLRMGRPGDAEQSFRAAIQLDSEAGIAHQGLALVLLRQKRSAEAVEAALEAVSLEFSSPIGHYLLGLGLLRTGERERAITAFRICLKLHPESEPAKRCLEALGAFTPAEA